MDVREKGFVDFSCWNCQEESNFQYNKNDNAVALSCCERLAAFVEIVALSIIGLVLAGIPFFFYWDYLTDRAADFWQSHSVIGLDDAVTALDEETKQPEALTANVHKIRSRSLQLRSDPQLPLRDDIKEISPIIKSLLSNDDEVNRNLSSDDGSESQLLLRGEIKEGSLDPKSDNESSVSDDEINRNFSSGIEEIFLESDNELSLSKDDELNRNVIQNDDSAPQLSLRDDIKEASLDPESDYESSLSNDDEINGNSNPDDDSDMPEKWISLLETKERVPYPFYNLFPEQNPADLPYKGSCNGRYPATGSHNPFFFYTLGPNGVHYRLQEISSSGTFLYTTVDEELHQLSKDDTELTNFGLRWNNKYLVLKVLFAGMRFGNIHIILNEDFLIFYGYNPDLEDFCGVPGSEIEERVIDSSNAPAPNPRQICAFPWRQDELSVLTIEQMQEKLVSSNSKYYNGVLTLEIPLNGS